MNLSANSRLVLVKGPTSSAGTAVQTGSVDASGFDSVMFFGTLATASGNRAFASISEDDSTFLPLEEAEIAPTANGNVFVLDLHRPLGGAYLHLEVDRSGTASAVGAIYALLYNARQMPVAPAAGVDVALINAPVVADA